MEEGAIFCVNIRDEALCMYHMTRKERGIYYKFLNPLRKDYRLVYRKRKLKNKRLHQITQEFGVGIKLKQASIIKQCHYKTIVRNLNYFSKAPGITPLRIFPDEKFERWQPKINKNNYRNR